MACAGLLALAVIVLRKGRRPLRLPVALLALDMFAWNFATLAKALVGVEPWRWIDNAFSPLTSPLALHIVLLFVGKLRPWRWALYLAYGGAACLSLVAWAALFSPRAGAWVASSQQSIVSLALLVPGAILMAALLLRYLQRQVREEARMRARLLFAALLLGSIFGSTEFWDDLFPLPALGQLGALAMALLVALVVLRLRAPAREHAAQAAGYALGLSLLGLTAFLALARWASTNLAAAILVGVTVTVALALATIEVLTKVVRERRRGRRLGMVGQLSTQLAHELKNPLAALHGAVQFIEEECRREGVLQGKEEFFALIGQQVARIDTSIERYRRFTNELRCSPTDLRQLLEGVLELGLADEAERQGVEIDLELEMALQLYVDPAQLSQALEDVLRNALSAMPEGGTLRIAAREGMLEAGVPAVVLEITDSGVGMDAEQCAQVLEGLHADQLEGDHGFALGLGLTRCVVEAHGGELRLQSQTGAGTMVALTMPLLPLPS